jgi:Icc-related predicted phosphoesterase
MNILAFTDFHGNQEAYEKAKGVIALQKPDFVIVAGDIINYDSRRAKQLLTDLAAAGRPIYYVPGNMDNAELGSWRGGGNLRGLHGRCENLENVSLIGLGGSPRGPFRTVFEFSEEEAAELLGRAMNDYRGGKLILVSHCPPKDTKVDRVSSGEHAGSISVRRFIEKAQPQLVISGHIHEAQGVDKIRWSTVVNTGPARNGDFAKIVVGDEVTVMFTKLM